jgi:hypothetical protein
MFKWRGPVNIKWDGPFGYPNYTLTQIPFITATIMRVLEAPKRHYKWNEKKGNPKRKKNYNILWKDELTFSHSIRLGK